MTSCAQADQPGCSSWAFFLGPDKAGSTWIHEVLASHGAVTVPRAKDLYYFDRFYKRGEAWYLRHFRPVASSRVCAEVCHDYLFHPLAPSRVRRFAPHARLLVCARDPVSRALSAFLYMQRQGRVSTTFSSAIRSVDELVDHGRYAHHLRRWLEWFPKSQIHVLDFDVLVRDPSLFAIDLFEAVGVSRVPPARNMLTPSRVSSRARSQIVATAGRSLAVALRSVRGERIVGYLKANRWIERALFEPLAPSERPLISDTDRAFLREALEEDARDLDALFGTDYAPRWWS